jgi:cytochrome P450
MEAALGNREIAASRPRGIGETVRIMRAALRNPLDGLPQEIFSAPIWRRRIFNRDIVYVMDPALIHAALVTNNDALDKGDILQRLLRPALGNGLLTAEGADWRWQRRAIAPVFRAGGIGRFQPAMRLAAERARDRMLALPADAPVAINDEMMRLTFDIIVETMLSGAAAIDVDATAKAVSDYLRNTGWSNLASLLGVPEWAPYPGKRRARVTAAALRRQLSGIVAERRRSGTTRNDLIDTLLQASDPQTGRRMTDEEITDNLLTFLTAGHETTALGLAWTLDLLGRHPHIARRVHEEAIAAGEGDAEALVYTRQVFQEALRLYPSAPLIIRRVSEPFRLGNYAMAPGMAVIVPIHAVHRHVTLWEAPEVFDPGRFAPPAAQALPRHAYMPFGAGPRVCVGAGFAMLEAVTILAVLLRDLRFTSLLAAPPKARMEITLRPERPLLMRVERQHAP